MHAHCMISAADYVISPAGNIVSTDSLSFIAANICCFRRRFCDICSWYRQPMFSVKLEYICILIHAWSLNNSFNIRLFLPSY